MMLSGKLLFSVPHSREKNKTNKYRIYEAGKKIKNGLPGYMGPYQFKG